MVIVAAGSDAVLRGRGQGWSLSDWLSNVVLGALATVIVGILLARRQTRVQEALADLELTEKIAALRVADARLRDQCTSEAAHRAVLDCRAGLALVPLARVPMQEEYLRAAVRMVRVLGDALGSSLEPRATWSDADWEYLRENMEELLKSAEHNLKGASAMRPIWIDDINSCKGRILELAQGEVLFTVFRRHFTQSQNRIRTLLDWNALARLAPPNGNAVWVEHLTRQVTDPAALASYFTVWYTRSDGTETEYDHPEARPISLASLAEGTSCYLGRERRDRIKDLHRHYAAKVEGKDIRVLIATYPVRVEPSAPDAREAVVILDGNHRLAALVQLAREGCPFTIAEFRLHAPADPAFLPDLSHHVPDTFDGTP
ncbi:hypothetical protein [Streptomyces sp. AV19]|uniref:hypothetical protein n=1 Tax=Streptomyces sp. AV19 TaxID=2793068 RepID=UPI0018FE12DA|nr:hypothetical protein [Streptomyces sp. AV19]MDG4533508.1 hypothetical protein [Streptomyces sp. AV19]